MSGAPAKKVLMAVRIGNVGEIILSVAKDLDECYGGKHGVSGEMFHFVQHDNGFIGYTEIISELLPFGQHDNALR